MKKLKIFGLIATVALMFGCSSKFLDVSPMGGTVDEKQFRNNSQSSEALVRGLYSLMIEVNDHDLFGQKSIDIKTDMITGDLALTNYNYGWFAATERLQEYRGTLASYMWSYYYLIIKNANIIIRMNRESAANSQTLQDTINSYYAGQAYAMRGYAYSALSYYYNTTWGKTDQAEKIVPYYSENDTTERPSDLIKLGDLFDQTENDFITAQNLIARYEALPGYSRLSKIAINTDVVKLMLANHYLHRAQILTSDPDLAGDCQKAITLCDEIITSGKYPILSYEKLLTNGFNSVSESDNWMWGIDIDAETTGGLASFWGAMDVFTYSYAYAGDIKAIDKLLYNSMPDTDKRKQWFSTTNSYAPVNKFFDKARKKGGDRTWLNDLVFMRSEEAYLIGAEAAYVAFDFPKAAQYLQPLLEQRDPTVAATITSSPSDSILKHQIIYNWRVEMWGEGRTYFTMRRFASEYFDKWWCDKNDKQTNHRGDNHVFSSSQTVTSAQNYILMFYIPASEQHYNPWISGQSEFEHQ
ncbi:MAG: RagB/SusD family nutrient uptake outer membrane protein [Prevotellaceae bacterium]|jgi:hypothetical protein|nr:RagB/SusD family nutrient uptake outer membrane protein [Prevotellaceae bacterium]